VKWPSGVIDLLENLTANETIPIVENSNALSIRDDQHLTSLFTKNPTNESVTLKSINLLSKVSVYNALAQQVLSRSLSKKNMTHTYPI
jgi:hypothetical protein